MATQVAHPRDQPRRLADEQAALRRVATLVAMESPLADVMAGVAEAVADVLGDVDWAVARDDGDGMATVLARSDGSPMPAGTRVPIDVRTAFGQAILERRPARIDYATSPDWEIARIAREHGIHEAVSCSIVVRGRVWGAMSVGWRRPDLFPPETETILAGLSELVAAAIANAEARAQAGRLIDEQAALRRVAMLVAESPESEELISAVAREVARVMDVRGVIVERFEADGSQVILGSSFDVELPGADALLGVGVRFPLLLGTLAAGVFETHRSARVEDYSTLKGSMGEAARAVGIGSGCAAPIIVDGRLWGLMCVYSNKGTGLPAGTEAHLEDFVELVATAISNFEARASLRLLADEQAALRRVATLVAHGASPFDLFAAVAEEVGLLNAADHGFLTRIESDQTVTAMARWTNTGEPSPVVLPRRYPFGPLATAIVQGGGPVRVDPYSDPNAGVLEAGLRSSVAAPITVEGETWGMIGVSSMIADRPPPPGTEERLTKFADLVATAIANAESREALARLAEEQAALRRVAELIAHEASPAELFDSVAEEAARVLSIAAVGLLRFDADGMATLVAGRDPQVPDGDQGTANQAARPPSLWDRPAPGTRFALDGENPIADVVRTGHAARMDDWASATGTVAAMATALGVRSTVVIPIVVEGRPWGALIVASRAPEPLPADTLSRAEQFTGLTATAIANAEARTELSRLVEEQAALRRVAELVAREASTAEILDAVVMEAARVMELEAVGLMRFGPDATATVVAQSETPFETAPLGTQYALQGENAIAQIARTGEAVRIDDWTTATGSVAEEAAYRGVRSSVGTPIVAQGRIWGVLIASTSATEPLPADTEARIAQFAGLVATAISNAESRDALKQLADEQAALRQVAELVAREATATEIFDAVTAEAARVLDIDAVGLLRFEPNAITTLLAQSQTPWDPPPLGTQFPLDGENPIAQVARTGEAVRLDDWSDATGAVAAMATVLGVHSCVATPILVKGRLWGTLIAATNGAEPLPFETESRIEQFTGLVATAISNAESRDAISQLADEQAALRRVATLVAAGVPPTVIFTAVSREIEHIFRLEEASKDRVTVVRFDPGPASVVVGAAKDDPEEPIGMTWEPKPLYVSTKVLVTGASARIDEHELETVGGSDAESLRRRGFLSQVGSPILVRRRLWGAVTLNAGATLPPDTEMRLEKFTELVATAVANAEAQSDLAASRRRIVSASDEARRQIERDLHDGTQQRLVSLGLALRAAEAMVPPDQQGLRVELSDIAAGLTGAVEDLQELSRGIHPAILSTGGLLPALRTLARRSAIPVDLEIPADIAVPESIEVAAYFVTSEALANAAKHGRASHVDISLDIVGDVLVLAIRDDGVGGADPSLGSGLVGLADRVEALGGSVAVDSRPGEGTSIIARLPIQPDP